MSEDIDANLKVSEPQVQVPEVRIDQSNSPARTSTQTDPLPHSHASSSRASLSPLAAAAPTRSRRATMDGRSNRLSGFFSHLLATRRPERDPPMPRERSVSPPPSPMRPTAAARPVTPPPPLASPTLRELGLELELITSNLTSAQYAMAPTSGTFLAPHYLLLCHGQGLDVLPLSAPPAPQPYALVRRVAFKSVIVMEERGVLVAIAGRRDGVRVYALEEVRRAVEWRLDLELKREAEAARRSRSRGTPGVTLPPSNSAPSALPLPHPKPIAPPPSYSASVEPNLRPLLSRVSTTNLAAAARNRGGSLSSILGLAQNATQKSEWADFQPSDEEVLVAAGPEASAALDERTSASAQQQQPQPPIATVASPPLQIGGASARRATVGAESAATLSSMRSALAHSRSNSQLLPRGPTTAQPDAELEIGADSVSFAEMLRESRMPPPPVPPNTTQRRASVVMLQSQSHPVFQPGELDPVGEDTDPPPTPGDDPRPRRWSFVAPSSASLPEPIASRVSVHTTPNTVPAPPIPLPPIPPPSPRQGSHRSTRSHPLPNIRPPTPPTTAPPRRRLFPKILSAFGSKKHRSKSRDRAASTGVGSSTGAGTSNAHIEVPTEGATAAPKLEYIKLPGTKGALMIKAVETPKKSFLAILCGDSGEKVELFAGTYRTALGLSRTFILPDSPKSLELQLQGDDLVEVFLVFAQNVFGLEPATVRVREVRIGRNERRAIRRRARAANGGSRTVETPEGPSTPGARTETVITTTVTVGQDQTTPASRRSTSLARRRREIQGRVVTSPDAPPVPVPAPQPTDPAMAEELAALSSIQSGPYTTFQQLAFAPQFPLAAIADDYVIPPTYLDFCEYREKWEPDLPRVEPAPGPREEEERVIVVEELEDDPAHGLQIEGEPEPEPEAEPSAIEPFPIPTPAPTPPPPAPTVVKWYYLDPKGVVQGPWKPSIMQNWLREGYLPPELPVRRADETEYTLLKDLRASVEDPAEPFRARVVRAPPSPLVVPPTPVVVPPTPVDQSEIKERGKEEEREREVKERERESKVKEREHEVVEASGSRSREGANTPIDAPDANVPVEASVPNTPVEPTTPVAANIPAEASTSSLPATPDPNPLAPFTPTKALLKPISLLAQPRHFGPPALFYCSRGGHSTTIVDARGRPVLKGRIHWSANDAMGDTHRIEAFDVGNRAVLVALRQGGIEALDVGEALLEPGDESRTAVPAYRVQLAGGTSRPAPWVWKLGTSVSAVNANTNGSPGYHPTGVENGKR
ncbi:unnamed protein product, partial [Rhizoctonia solani]